MLLSFRFFTCSCTDLPTTQIPVIPAVTKPCGILGQAPNGLLNSEYQAAEADFDDCKVDFLGEFESIFETAFAHDRGVYI
jgi:hypothetical protein